MVGDPKVLLHPVEVMGFLIDFLRKKVESFSNQGGVFAKQLINLYTSNLGQSAYLIIAIAAFTTMFSTTITTLDASPRAMSKTIQLLFRKEKDYYIPWIIILASGTSLIFIFLLSERPSKFANKKL